MLLVNTKEESSANKTVRSDRFMSTLCRPNLATWRHKVSHEADGRGNVLAGGERGGKSHITYRPYGEILRTDSFGPDISKYKYTGQEEDRESGLMFYKARYYDSKIGRFLQQDSEIQPDEPNGMNRMMYVHGKPLHYTDQTGKKLSTPLANAMTEYFFSTEGEKEAAFVYGFFKGKQIEKEEKRNKYHQKVYKFLDGLGNFLITLGVGILTYAAFTGVGALVGGIVTTVGVIVKCAASGYKSNFIDKDSSDSTYLSFSYSNPPPPGEENKPGPRPPDTRSLIITSEAEKVESPDVGCSSG